MKNIKVVFEKGNIFESGYDIIHTVSADLEMGTGFAKQVIERYPYIRKCLLHEYRPIKGGDCLKHLHCECGDVIAVYSLVTKNHFWEKNYSAEYFKNLRYALRHIFDEVYEAAYFDYLDGMHSCEYHFAIPFIGSERYFKKILSIIKDTIGYGYHKVVLHIYTKGGKK